MATNPIGGSPSPVIIPNLFSTFDRGTLASAVEVLVAVLDAMDGDPELEDATGLEDEGITPSTVRYYTDGPGCIASDPGEPVGDEKDCAWVEWENLSRSQKGSRNVLGVNDEDAEDGDPKEDDDPSGQCDEDEINTTLHAGWGIGAGCPISDPGGCEHNGREDC